MPERILIVGAQNALFAALSGMLAAYACVSASESEARALLTAPERPVCAALLAVSDCGEGAAAFLRALRSGTENADTPLLAVLSKDAPASERMLLGAGASDCLRLPCDPALLSARLSQLLRLQRALEAEARHRENEKRLRAALAALQRNGEELRTKAESDALTGLYNRSGLRAALEARGIDETRGAFIMLDLDDLKQLNDGYGHACGDAALRFIGARMAALFRPQDVLGRLGGDEFVVFMREISGPETAKQRVDALIRSLGSFCFEGQSLPLACSAGIALCPAHGRDFDALYRRADEALYLAKRKGKHGCVLCGAEN